MVNKRKKRRSASPAPQKIGNQIYKLLSSMGGTPERCLLSSLWSNWENVIGADLARIAVPAGSRGHTLLLDAQDAMQIQELQFLSCDILERVNNFLGSAYFTSIRPLLGGKKCLPRSSPVPETTLARSEPDLPCVTGKYLAKMDMNSPIAICYARFANRSS